MHLPYRNLKKHEELKSEFSQVFTNQWPPAKGRETLRARTAVHIRSIGRLFWMLALILAMGLSPVLSVSASAEETAEETKAQTSIQNTPPTDLSNNRWVSRYKAKLELLAAHSSGTARRFVKESTGPRHRYESSRSQAASKVQPVARVIDFEAATRSKPIVEVPPQDLANTLTDARFSKVMSSWRGVKRCVELITRRGLVSSGSVKMTFKINTDGSVKESKVADSSSTIARRIGTCVARRARNIQFPAYAGTKTVTKAATFILQ